MKSNEGGMLLLMNNAVFYRFEICAIILPVEGLKTKVAYQLLNTNTYGLWRYDTGDVVEILNAGSGPCSKIIGRSTHDINAFGEEVVIEIQNRQWVKACTLIIQTTDFAVRS
ncbi:MAG: GH3 auxin-responsive promoter family protein [Saprospiraceae bacterium]|nr:GH3 auxin-responsive promoter family protein [Saprospiraceae bacterium]